MDKCRREYFRFYHDYKRGGVSDDKDYAQKRRYKMKTEKTEEEENPKEISAVMKELMKVKLREPPSTKTTRRSKEKPPKSVDPQVQRKKLEAFMKNNSEQIFAFEELMLRGLLDYDAKVAEIEGKDYARSDALSWRRVCQGKDPQSTKPKYALAWKLLTDPLTRAMVSDQFMEAWHDRMFPKWINPFKFKRMEKELSLNQDYYKRSAFKITDEAQSQRYQQLSEQFETLSKEIIELSVNVFPPSLKDSRKDLISSKERRL